MSKKETSSKENKVSKKDNHLFKNIIIVIVFLAIGISVGIFGTLRYLDYKKELEEAEQVENVDEGPEDITEDEDSQGLIQSLLKILDGNTMFYSTKGVSVSTLDNTSKLKLVYNNIVDNKMGTSEEKQSLWIGSTSCDNVFITDVGENPLISTNKCSVYRISKETFKKVNKTLFNDDILDTSVEFQPYDGYKCVLDGESYVCGNVAKTSDITGELISKFDILKVTKDEDGTIEIYEKGYLVDKRSNVNNPNDQYDNYYLHSSDSKEYYYELKSADNLTFKHTFKTIDRQNYYYVCTELVKE